VKNSLLTGCNGSIFCTRIITILLHIFGFYLLIFVCSHDTRVTTFTNVCETCIAYVTATHASFDCDIYDAYLYSFIYVYV